VLRCVVVCCSVLQCVAVYCSVMQCVAVCCSVLRCVAVCCGLKCLIQIPKTQLATALQHAATHCNTLQHTATHCNTLQHTATQNASSKCPRFQMPHRGALCVHIFGTPLIHPVFFTHLIHPIIPYYSTVCEKSVHVCV